jgi:hypothetical protein
MLNGKHGYGCDKQKQGFGGSGFQGQGSKPILGSYLRNITLNFFETHLTSQQHRIYFKKLFISNFISKDCPNHAKLILIFQMSGEGNKRRK